MIRTALTCVAAAGLAFGAWAIAGENCCKDKAGATAAKGGGCCGSKEMVKLSEPAQKALNENAAYQKADELVKSWSEAPAKLVAMTEDDKKALAASREKMSVHPAATVIKPSVQFVGESLRTIARIDKAAQQMCGAQCGSKQQAAAGTDGAKIALTAGAAEGQGCPKMAAAKLKMEQSAGLVMKAAQLVSVANKACGECGDKGSCTKTKQTADGAGCPSMHAAKMAGAATQPSLTLVKAEAKEGGCCAGKAAAVAANPTSQPAMALAARADALISESGKLLAQWQDAGVVLTSMDETSRTAAENAVLETSAKCPAGRLMPATLATTREMLIEASSLMAQASTAMKGKEMSPEMKQLKEARSLLLSAAINVLDRTSTIAKPAKQMASAQ